MQRILGAKGWRNVLWTLTFLGLANAVFINFENCLDASIINSQPRQLQFIPYFFDAHFDTSRPSHVLNFTVYGNVSGQATEGEYPAPNDPSWSNPNDTFGKIVDLDTATNRLTTMFQKYQVITYDALDVPATRFCNSTINDTCPLTPSFDANVYDPYSLSAFGDQHPFNSSYAFGTITSTITVKSGADGAPNLACISASITPDLGKKVAGLLTYLPAAVLICVAIAVAMAGIYSPWGSSDPFKWTTNYGRDEDLLRLMTPGFGDCLQYIQFIFLTGALTLNYPGFFQPATSQASWAALLFNQSFVSHGPGFQSLVDGIYYTNGTYGMTTMSQLVGMSQQEDVWACMAVWLLVILGTAVALCQAAFVFRWIYRVVSNTQEQDLRRKNLPLTVGMLVRVIYNYFLLPIVAISFFQLVVTTDSVVSVVAVAAIFLIAIFALSFWIIWIIFRTKPRAHLFDDLPTVLLYGSLYNTYSDSAATFALIPVLLTFIRGIAIGAVQPSGIAQLVILAICEVIFILCLHAFRPFSSPTHMNIIHTFFASARLAIVLLMVAFVPSLGVTDGPRGWIGYAILLLHAIVLVFGFFLGALQTMIEVGARMAGAGGDPQLGAQRGGLISYGWRQLRNRQPEKARPGSMTSDAAILANDADAKSFQMGGRSRSMSASSQQLLNRPNRLSGFESYGQGGEFAHSPGADTPSGTSGFAATTQPSSSGSLAQSKKPVLALQTDPTPQQPSDPYYRQPRARRATIDPYTPGAKSRHSRASAEFATRPSDDWADTAYHGPGEGSGRDTPSPVMYRQTRNASDPELAEAGPRTDYAVREVDFYYGVTRGPALSSQPTARKRKTGPADPMGPVSAASSWFSSMFGGKTKDKGKGFEVVRSSRMPPELMQQQKAEANNGEEGQELQTSPPMTHGRYRDSPDIQAEAGAEAARQGIPPTEPTKKRMPLDGPWDADSSDGSEADDEPRPIQRASASPPRLQPIERSGSLHLGFSREPSRRDSEHGGAGAGAAGENGLYPPYVPRKSSRRHGSRDISHDTTPAVSPRLPPQFENERPTSMGHVQHRMTGDGIRQSAVGEGSAAEFVEGERTMSIE